MKAPRKPRASPEKLRSQTERWLTRTPRELAPTLVQDAQKLVEELQVHRLELEMQQDQLRRTELELQLARDRYADLYRFAPSAHMTLGADNEILEANLAASALLGLEGSQLVHQKFTRFVAPEAQGAFSRLRRQAIGSDTLQSVELAVVDATSKPMVVQLNAVRDPSNPRKQFRVGFTDITDRRRAEDALRETSQLNQQIILGAKEGVIVYDRHLKYLVWNPFMEALTGVPAAEVIGKLPAEVFSFLQPGGVLEQLNRVLAGKECVTKEFPFHIPHSGRSGWVSDTSSPLRNAKGDITGVIGIVHDITERKRAEERIAQLDRAKAILSGVDRAILHLPNQQKLLDEICRVAVEKGGFKLAWIGMVSPEGVVEPVAKAGATGYLDGIRLVTHDVPEGRGPVGMAIREHRPVVIEDIEQDASMAPWHEQSRRFGLHYVAAFPLRVGGKVAGAFQTYAPGANFFDENELVLLTQVSDDISFALTAIADLTARKQAEEALHRSEHDLTSFFNQAPIGLEWLSAGGSILRANQAQLDLLGYPAEEYLGHFLGEFCADPGGARELLARLAARARVSNLRLPLRHKEGTIRLVLVDAQPIWHEGEFRYSSVFSRDISERVNLERRILDISEREQRRIAQDLHDGLGQVLVGTSYLASSLRQKLAARGAPELPHLDRLLQVLDGAVEQTRTLAHGLHPVKPEPNGLMLALKALASQTTRWFRVPCRFTCRQPVLIEDSTTATHLYRIAQEAITNAIKHGQPGRIQISLTRTPDRLNLMVRDDGVGLPVTARKQPGLGLRIMNYRAGAIGGSLAIQREAGGGTTVVCSVHLSTGVLTSGLAPAPENTH